MKKLKNVLGITILALALMSMSTKKEKEQQLCQEIAAVFFNALEDEFGCYDDPVEAADVYHEIEEMVCEN